MGIATLRAGIVAGWQRFVPVLLGLWFFVQLPLQVIFFISTSGLPSYTLLLGIWGILWAVFGCVVLWRSNSKLRAPA